MGTISDAGCSLTKFDTWSSSFIVPQRLSFDIRSPLLSYLGSLVSGQSYTGCHDWLTLMCALQSCASHSLPHRASSTLDCLLPSAYVFVLDDSTPLSLSGFLLVSLWLCPADDFNFCDFSGYARLTHLGSPLQHLDHWLAFLAISRQPLSTFRGPTI